MSNTTNNTPNNNVNVDVVIVGAGWSGLACALTCADAGARVWVLDAAPQAGGRARALPVTLGEQRFLLDNGQHLLIGAYRQTEKLLRRVGIKPAKALLRQPLSLIYPDGFHFVATKWPAPLHLAGALLNAQGLTLKDRWALVHVVRAWRRAQWHAPAQATASTVLGLATPTLIERLFEPLCLAALNLRLHEASAQIFLRVLRDSIGGARRDSELWLPRTNLSALFPDAAIAALKERGSEVHLHTLVTSLTPTEQGWRVQTRNGAIDCRAVVLALPPERACDLLESTRLGALAEAKHMLARIDMAPIATVYLRYANAPAVPGPIVALRESSLQHHYGQWVINRSVLDVSEAHILAVVISGHGAHLDLPHPSLASAVAQQLSSTLGLAAPIAANVIVDRRATVRATPQLKRPPVRLPVRGLYLAGDAADNPYPSTIEGSIRSGLEAALTLQEIISAPNQ